MHKASIFILRKLSWHPKESLKHGPSLEESCGIRVFTYLSVIRQLDRLLCRTWVFSLYRLLCTSFPGWYISKCAFEGSLQSFHSFSSMLPIYGPWERREKQIWVLHANLRLGGNVPCIFLRNKYYIVFNWK